MTKYEIMYILTSTIDEDAKKAAMESIAEIITKNGGNVLETDDWGLKELAYEINKQRRGYYVLLQVEAPVQAINEFDRLGKINANLLRHMIIKKEV